MTLTSISLTGICTSEKSTQEIKNSKFFKKLGIRVGYQNLIFINTKSKPLKKQELTRLLVDNNMISDEKDVDEYLKNKHALYTPLNLAEVPVVNFREYKSKPGDICYKAHLRFI